VLTPNDVRERKKEEVIIFSTDKRFIPEDALVEIFVEVLEEIARGSIDPKSLALAALEPVEKD